MNERDLDCVIVGFHDQDLQGIMAAREKSAAVSGAYRHMLGSVFRHGGRWLHHVQYLNAVLGEATGREFNLHTMGLPNLAVWYLRSFLERAGLRAECVNFFTQGTGRLEELLREKPRAVVVTTTLYVESTPVKEIIAWVRQRSPDTPIITGGPHILTICSLPGALSQEALLSAIGADYCIHDAQGEATLVRLLHELRKPAGERQVDRIPNLLYPAAPGAAGAGAAAPRMVRTPREVEDNDIAGFTSDWERVPRDLCTPTASLITSRSCPFRCAFCRYPALAGPWRYVETAGIEKQLATLREAGSDTLILFDDTPNVPLQRFKETLRMMIRRGFGFRWFSNFRCANSDLEAMDLMAESGCRGVFLGIESGDQRILDNMNKRSTVEVNRAAIRALDERGIITYASFIVGFPGEDAESVENTARFIEDCRPTYYQVHEYYHSREAPIHARAAEFGLKGGDYSWRHATMDWQGAFDAVDRLRRDIRGSILGTSYLSTFWMIGYLHGKGVPLETLREFMSGSRDALLTNRCAPGAAGPGDPIPAGLLDVGRRMAAAMDARAGGSGRKP
jgi:p-methyltransferase